MVLATILEKGKFQACRFGTTYLSRIVIVLHPGPERLSESFKIHQNAPGPCISKSQSLIYILTAHFVCYIFQPPRNYQPAVASEPTESKAPPPRPPPPAPPVEKTVSCFAAFYFKLEIVTLCVTCILRDKFFVSIYLRSDLAQRTIERKRDF